VVSVALISVLNFKELVSDIKPLKCTTKPLAFMSLLFLGFELLYAGRLTVRYLVTSELQCYKAFFKVTA